MLLELFAGVLVGVFFLRAGVPSIFPLLIWIPALSERIEFGFVLGIAAAGLAHGLADESYSSREDIFIGFIFAALGLFFVEYFLPPHALDGVVFPLLFLALAGSLVYLLIFRPRDAAGGLLLLVFGWWLLHERVVPLVLPAFFLGWFGFSWSEHSIYASHSRVQKIRDACIGCLSGFLPGLGPGLINAAWASGRASFSMGVSNLVFSVGLLSQTGNVRSAVAAQLSNGPLPHWTMLVVIFSLGVLVAFFITVFFSRELFPVPAAAWILFQVAGILFIGGWSAGAVVLVSYSLRRFFQEKRLSVHSGMLVLVPSILWFYFPF